MSVLLETTAIAGAVSAVVGPVTLRVREDTQSLLFEAKFLYGAGGTTAKFWVQTRVDGGTWRDIANFAFTTAPATKFSAVTHVIALAAAVAVSDAVLADDTILNGFLGDAVRVKYTTTGTYTGATSIGIRVSAKRG